MKVTALCGGVGASRFLQGLYPLRKQNPITAIVNVGDDVVVSGLRISPDIDTVTYALAGLVDETRGWGLRGDTFNFMEAMRRLGSAPYLMLGDGDLATHVHRTGRLAEGATLEQVTLEISRALGLEVSILPVTNQKLTSMVVVGEQHLTFEEYFVKLKSEPTPSSIYFEGSSSSVPSPGVQEALSDCSVLIICPSNPIASIAPILAVPGVYPAVARSPAYRVAVTPIVSGKTIKGPADKMMIASGFDASPVGVAQFYTGLIDCIVIDKSDERLRPDVESMGLDCLVSDTIMRDSTSKERFAREVMGFASSKVKARTSI